MSPEDEDPTPEGAHDTVHAGAVALDGRGVLILGAAGSGKTALTLELLALGAWLVADDRVVIERHGDGLRLTPPPPLAGLVELRGFGLLKMPASRGVPLALIADLDAAIDERMPARPPHRALLGVEVPLLPCRDRPAPAAAVVALMRADAWLGGHYLPR